MLSKNRGSWERVGLVSFRVVLEWAILGWVKPIRICLEFDWGENRVGGFSPNYHPKTTFLTLEVFLFYHFLLNYMSCYESMTQKE